MNFRVGGAVAAAAGVLLTLVPWFVGPDAGELVLLVAVLGPMAVLLGLAFAALPVDWLVVPRVDGGRRVYRTESTADYTLLGKVLAGVGAGTGVLYAVLMLLGR